MLTTIHIPLQYLHIQITEFIQFVSLKQETVLVNTNYIEHLLLNKSKDAIIYINYPIFIVHISWKL